MAYRVVWSPKAVEDVDVIASYIGRDSSSYAAAVVRKIIDTTHSLDQFPLSGEIAAECNDPMIREQLAYTYRIIYRIKENTITIAAIIHTKRLLNIND
jgi:toxin ParE1/3/4